MTSATGDFCNGLLAVGGGLAAFAGLMAFPDILGDGLSSDDVIDYSKKSKSSGKQRASDAAPEWAKETEEFQQAVKDRADGKGKSGDAQKVAKKILDGKYGPGEWPKGPGSEYNRIIKGINRSNK